MHRPLGFSQTLTVGNPITPATPPHRIADLLTSGAAELASGDWWQWPNVVEGFQLGAQQALADAARFPEPTEPRGIVIVGGGKYLPSAYVTVRVLRHVGCQLPIEVWHFDNENDSRIEAAIQEFDVRLCNANPVQRQPPFRFLSGNWWQGWQLKSFALLHSRFESALLLDADNYPTRNPEYLFEWSEFINHGAVIWPDLPHSPTTITPAVCRLFEIDPPTERLAESGQLLVNRRQCWQQLILAGYYNQAADVTYQYIWGDKDTFPFAWQRTGKSYARMWPECQAITDCLLQYDYNCRVIFQHRVGDKFKLAGDTFASTPQLSDVNRFNAGLAHESFCFHALKELAAILR